MGITWSHRQLQKSNSARALISEKIQEPGIKLQKADFFRNDRPTR